MADEEIPDASTPVVDAATEAPKPAPKKRKPVEKNVTETKLARGETKAKSRVPTDVVAKPRRYSEAERSQKITAIDTDLAKGTTLKAAVKSAGVSEKTYYQWKKSTKPPEATKSAPRSIAYEDLVELEKENQRLRSQLAEKLRAENEDLRKRLGLM